MWVGVEWARGPATWQPIADFNQKKDPNLTAFIKGEYERDPTIFGTEIVTKQIENVTGLTWRTILNTGDIRVVDMAQSVPPGDIATQPGTRIVFNAPYDDKQAFQIRMNNSSVRRIGWTIKANHTQRLGVYPECGVLDPYENAMVDVSCDGFVYEKGDTAKNRVAIEWTNTPDGAAKQFHREWFQGDGMIRRKNLPVEYNP